MLLITPVPQLRTRWFEVAGHMRRLDHTLDQAARRVGDYAGEHRE